MADRLVSEIEEGLGTSLPEKKVWLFLSKYKEKSRYAVTRPRLRFKIERDCFWHET